MSIYGIAFSMEHERPIMSVFAEPVTKLDPAKLEKAAEMLKALAHPTRLAIVDLLDQGRRLTVSEIHQALKIEQAVASHHLRILKDRGAVLCEREGKNRYYCQKHELMSQIISCVEKCS